MFLCFICIQVRILMSLSFFFLVKVLDGRNICMSATKIGQWLIRKLWRKHSLIDYDYTNSTLLLKVRKHISLYKDYCVFLKTYFTRFSGKHWVEDFEEYNLCRRMRNVSQKCLAHLITLKGISNKPRFVIHKNS